MKKNKVLPNPSRQNSMSSQFQPSTQQNFVSVHEVSSLFDTQKKSITIHNIRKKYMMQNLINRLKFLIAPSTQTNEIKQNWTQQPKVITRQDLQEAKSLRETILSDLSYNQTFWKVLKLLQAICVVALFWAASTELFFSFKYSLLDDNVFSFSFKFPFCLVIFLKTALKQLWILHAKIKAKSIPQQQLNKDVSNEQNNHKNDIKCSQLCDNLGDFSISLIDFCMCFLYLLIDTFRTHQIGIIMQSLVVVHFTWKTWNSKDNLQILYNYVQGKDLRKQFRIVVVFFLVMGICHIFALIMFAMTYINPQKNWLSSKSIPAAQMQTWFSDYTCSFYFAMTTMATVGYGDFTPVQLNQIVVVTFIQLFGSAVFGYMINVMGLTVAEINTKNQAFQNHISTIHKMEKHYQISRQLCQKFKQQIVKNQSIKKQTPLSQTEQTEFFKMIQNTLKQEFILQTNIRVIKKSIFFLTHFTVNFQNQIALKLIRKIYKKNQVVPLLQMEGDVAQRRMLIINSGSVNIELEHQYNNIQMRKYIKNISPIQGKPALNVFGYSSLILNTDIDLVATTKDTSVIYLLKRRDVLQCMDKNMLDFEGIGQIRQKMLQYYNVNHIEAPSMMEIDKHYVPNVFFVHKKKKTGSQNRRSDFDRGSRKGKIRLITIQNFQYRTMMCIDIEDEIQKTQNKIKSVKGICSYRQNQNIDNRQNEEISFEQNSVQTDQVKIFQNFMKKSNINKLLLKYQQYLKGIRRQKKMLTNLKEFMHKAPVRSATRIHSLNCQVNGKGVAKSQR